MEKSASRDSSPVYAVAEDGAAAYITNKYQ